MKSMKIGILDLVTKKPSRGLYGRIMNPNLASIMPQAVGVWLEQMGHRVTFCCYTGAEDLTREIPEDLDALFIGAFTQSAFLAYSISRICRARGMVTILGGPHARAYASHARRYFDYVLGFTDRALIEDLMSGLAIQRPEGLILSAKGQPASLPGVRERWRFIEPTIRKNRHLQVVPMMASLGCPYRCSFCIDSVVDYQPLPYDQIREDLLFLRKKFKVPKIGWHDPNFGVRFDECMDVIESAIPPGGAHFVAESSLAILKGPRLKRLKQNGFLGILPGIESWHDTTTNAKSAQTKMGWEKVRSVADHINQIQSYIPYIQTNFVLGLDCDEGEEPFEMTKKFLDLCPAAFPAFSLLTVFGDSAPLNLEYQKAGRVLEIPFHFLDNHTLMNIQPLHYEWTEFYDRIVDLTRHAFRPAAIWNRFRAAPHWLPRWMNIVRGISTEGWGRLAHFRRMRSLLDTDPEVLNLLSKSNGHKNGNGALPAVFRNSLQSQLGPFYEHLPPDALQPQSLDYEPSPMVSPIVL